MKRNLKLLVVVLFTITNTMFGQKISNIDYDLIKQNTEDSSSIYYYPKLIQRLLLLDTTFTEKEYSHIYFGNVFTANYSPYSKDKNEEKFNSLYNEEKYDKAIEFGQKSLKENPVNLNVLFRLMVCYHVSGDKITAKKYAKLYYGLLNEIYESGDGKSIKTAYVVIKISDEYQILKDLELQSTGQALLSGPTDRISINTENQKEISEIYFNIAKPFESLSKMFKKK